MFKPWGIKAKNNRIKMKNLLKKLSMEKMVRMTLKKKSSMKIMLLLLRYKVFQMLFKGFISK